MLKNSCTVLIFLSKNKVNLSMCHLFFFALCLTVFSSCSSSCHSHSLAALCLFFFFVCFWRSWFCRPAIIHISNQSKAWFSFFFLYSREKYNWLGWLGLPINYTNMQLYEVKCVSYSISAENIFDQSEN